MKTWIQKNEMQVRGKLCSAAKFTVGPETLPKKINYLQSQIDHCYLTSIAQPLSDSAHQDIHYICMYICALILIRVKTTYTYSTPVILDLTRQQRSK